MLCFLHEVSNVAVVRATYFMSISLAPANSPWTTTLHHTRDCSSSLASDRHLLWLKHAKAMTGGTLRRSEMDHGSFFKVKPIKPHFKSLKYSYYQSRPSKLQHVSDMHIMRFPCQCIPNLCANQINLKGAQVGRRRVTSDSSISSSSSLTLLWPKSTRDN